MIATFCRNTLQLTEKQSATVQLAVCGVVFIATFIFTDFFVSVAILLIWLAPMWFLYMYLIQGMYSSFTFLNHAR